ncbi:MAG: hypothetical protein JAY75_23075 [Candidatus Thiodiazotropha taylori]|nr:hypothetical protein [Candidatus Thiodiazotropha taylori]MCW4226981.1 hypothetical protein [Candidatus Thiodiazotropha endolucinida]MCG7888540.1 hypothetical protein [Candidatus Thiodiazotropha taylori]MCG7892266.1 hypothetical protein [Candidatus Thiodiazotropha taylori]MCG8031111.1 hypothetical protein [Candidatus Thiodiazotropha taylori]
MSRTDPQKYLLSVLADGRISTSRLYPWAESKGINKRALQRAAKELGINTDTKDPRNGRYRLWSLPAKSDTDDQVRQPNVSHIEESATPVLHMPDTRDTEPRQEQMTQDTKVCHATPLDDASQTDTIFEEADTALPVLDTAETDSEATDTVIPAVATAITAEDLDWDDHSNVLTALHHLVKPAELAVIDGFALNGERSYTDVLNSLLRQGIIRVRNLQQQRRY